jgi:hypothetical protein
MNTLRTLLPITAAIRCQLKRRSVLAIFRSLAALPIEAVRPTAAKKILYEALTTSGIPNCRIS